MTLTLALLGIIGFALVVYGGVDAYLGRISETPAGSGFFNTPEHQGRTLAPTIVGVLISLVSSLGLSLAR